MLKIILVRPGATDLDLQGRITGTLDIPLSDKGEQQARQTAEDLSHIDVTAVVSAPCLAAQQTAAVIAQFGDLKVRVDENLLNLDHGLWHGMRLAELKVSHPKFFKQWRDNPDSISPPGGETVDAVKARVERALRKIRKKNRSGVVVVVVPEPLRSILQNEIDTTKCNIFEHPFSCGQWQVVDSSEDIMA